MTALPAIMNPEPGDNEDVVSALETADVFWTKGDTDEALRWLKRAAETASDAGNDMRALVIARGVADLKSAPSPAPEAPRVSRPPAPSNVQRHVPVAPSSGLISSAPQAEPVESRRPPPLPPSKSRESTAPPAPSSRLSTTPPPAGGSAVPMAPSRTQSSDRMAAVTVEPTRASALPPQPTRASAPTSTTSSAEPAPSIRRSPTTSSLAKEPHRAISVATAYRAVTVFVKPPGRNGDKLEVILAKPGQAVPAGAEPALLVPTRRGGRLLG